LRAHPEEAETYERLKRRLAAEHQTDREAYTDAEFPYLESVMRKASKQGCQSLAQMRSAGSIEQCPLSAVTRKTFVHTEFFSV
jgi:hypothetical protein